jgi:hypothetical protein
MLLRRTLQFLLLSGLVLQASACKEESSQDLLEQQQQRWRVKHPERYVVEICVTPWHDECQRIAVEGDSVLAAQSGEFGIWQSIGELSALEQPIDRLFDVAKARDEDCILKKLEFDAQYGFVAEYAYQCRDPDDDYGEEVVCFVEDADSLEACDL